MATIIDVAIPGEARVVIVLVVIGALGAVNKNLEKYVEKLEIDSCVKIM